MCDGSMNRHPVVASSPATGSSAGGAAGSSAGGAAGGVAGSSAGGAAGSSAVICGLRLRAPKIW